MQKYLILQQSAPFTQRRTHDMFSLLMLKAQSQETVENKEPKYNIGNQEVLYPIFGSKTTTIKLVKARKITQHKLGDTLTTVYSTKRKLWTSLSREYKLMQLLIIFYSYFITEVVNEEKLEDLYYLFQVL